uniref:Uncharacterized protein n=1 Tax=Neobodo designis TaxID=312471 RepID=A0A7S1W482_NEODS
MAASPSAGRKRPSPDAAEVGTESTSGEARDASALEQRARPQPRPVADAIEIARAHTARPGFTFNHFTLRCLARELDPAIELSDAAAERLLADVDHFMSTVFAHAKATSAARAGLDDAAAAPIDRADVAASLKALYDIELPAESA